jgi:ATP-dependent Clp protease ATP-binding subunit ClpA
MPDTGGVFERFTDLAQRAVLLAQEEARLLQHNYIGTEHLLLGLVREEEGIAARALVQLGISLQVVRDEIERVIGQGGEASPSHIPFTPRAKQVLELSQREALQLGHTYIGTEHLLLGLIREGEGVASQVLVRLGADLGRVRRQVIQLLSGDPGAEAMTGGPTGPSATRATGPGYEAAALLRRWPEGPIFRELLDAGEEMRARTLEALIACWDGDTAVLELRLGEVVRLAALAADDAQLARLGHIVEIEDALQGVVRLRPRTPPTGSVGQ